MFLQALPTQNWGEKEIELLLSEAYAPLPPSFYAPSSPTEVTHTQPKINL